VSGQRRKYLTWALAILLGIAVFSVGYLAMNPSLTTASHTEFYLPGVDGNATTYPETVPPGNTTAFTVGISNYEHRTVTYRVAVAVNGTETTDRTVRIEHGDTREPRVNVTLPADPGRYRLQFRLYYGDGTTPDLTTRYWIQVRE
jgi:uncharacterized membrane protein